MKKYRIFARETIFYTIETEAENKEQAKEGLLSGNIDVGEGSDSADFTVTDIEEIK